MRPELFSNMLAKEGLTFLTGVPCSNLGNFLEYINSHKTPLENIIATSEGEAVGIAAGYHLATGEVPVVYLQNSGFGNTVNPLTSLMDREVYSIPALLLLTWRGEPGIKDEPQHKKMGRVMLDLLRDLEIPYEFASGNLEETAKITRLLKDKAVNEQKPAALIFRAGLFEKCNLGEDLEDSLLLTREQILENLLPKIGEHPIVTTTGKTSREVFELREKLGQSHKYDFLTVGSMGCASGIGLGIALQNLGRVYVIDGDGAALMKMGTLATIGHYKPQQLTHIIIDNGQYESTGGQPTVSQTVNWEQVLKGVGYPKVDVISTKKELDGLIFGRDKRLRGVVVYSKSGSRADLGRPTTTPMENKDEFMGFISALQATAEKG